MEHQIFTQRVLRTSVLEQKIQSIWEVTGCDRCSVATENQILFTKVIKYICGWLVLLKMSALESMKLILLHSVFDVTRLFTFVYLKWSCSFPGHMWGMHLTTTGPPAPRNQTSSSFIQAPKQVKARAVARPRTPLGKSQRSRATQWKLWAYFSCIPLPLYATEVWANHFIP